MEPDLPSHQPKPRRGKHRKHRSLSDSISLVGSYTIGWAAPTEQVSFLVSELEAEGNADRWAAFRDGFMSKWTNLNIVCGLIMGAISTVMFADVELDKVSFGFGVVSLLSSLISIGFGTGLMYVLGDVDGGTLGAIGKRYPILFVFALSIPQVWAGICIVSFFLCTGIFAWNASDKGWTAKAGIIFSAALTIAHLIAFARLFHKQHAVETMFDDEGDGGMKHNIHLAPHRSLLAADPDKLPERPGPVPLQNTHVGSGVGHFIPSLPDSQSIGIQQRVVSQPLVDSPDPASQEFAINRNSGGAASGSGSGSSRSREPAPLFAQPEVMELR